MTTPYKHIRDSLDTGDIVLFSGDGIVSSAIKFATRSQWSHVGMVLRIPIIDAVLLWESTTLSDLKGIISGERNKGVQLVALSERVNSYNGDIAVRRLSVERSPAMIDELSLLRQEVAGRPYEKDRLELALAAFGGTPFGEDLDSLFCSELVAEAYQRMGLLPDVIASNSYDPADFSTARTLTLLKGELGPEVPITACPG